MTEPKVDAVDAPASVEPATTPELVSSPEVKVDAPVADATPAPEKVDESKMQSQIDNLNTALRQEREATKTASKEWEDKMANSQETIDKLKSVFSPEQQDETPVEGVTMDQLETMLDSRDEKRREDTRRAEQQATMKSEVTKLEEAWDGADGKPAYDDKKVLDWQETNSKLHLSPSEAFNEMNRDSIIDWEIKKRMSQKPDIQTVETPGGVPEGREPIPTKPKTDGDLRNAVLEAMNVTSDENIN